MWPRLLHALYLTTLALLPWSWFPPFPWFHQNAQWSDLLFAATVAVWVAEKWRARQWPRFHSSYIAMALYVIIAILSLSASDDPGAGAWKLVGICELVLLAMVTADLAVRPRMSRLIAQVIAGTSLLSCVAGTVGLVLFYAGMPTELLGTYGDLAPSPWYARVQAGTIQPNMLASFCLFASAVVARPGSDLSPRFRRITQAALWLTVLLTFSRGILAFGLAAGIRGARTRAQRWGVVAYAVTCVTIILVLSFWNLSFNPAQPFDTHFVANKQSSRSQTAVSSLRTLKEHPLFGSGVGTSPGFYQGMAFDAHLTPLNIAATMGLPALLAFVALFLFLWRDRKRPADLAVWSALGGLALDSLATDIEDFRHLWVLIGLAIAPSADRSESTGQSF
jgi:hypothetical protein